VQLRVGVMRIESIRMFKKQLLLLAALTCSACGGTAINAVGGAETNTGNAHPTIVSISYNSHQGNTVVVACGMNGKSTITSVADGGSKFTLRRGVTNGNVRVEIWSTDAGAAVTAGQFKIALSEGGPASCAVEEYSGVKGIGNTGEGSGSAGTWGVSLKTSDPNNYVVAAIGANSYYRFSNPTGTVRRTPGLANNSGEDYVEMQLLDSNSPVPANVTNSVVTAAATFAAAAVELRSVGP
jgi:hypothetical protein